MWHVIVFMLSGEPKNYTMSHYELTNFLDRFYLGSPLIEIVDKGTQESHELAIENILTLAIQYRET